MIEQQILNYKITTEIGKGGMATVYKAVHTKLDTVVAIKVLDPILATNETIYKRFVQEAKIMASLNHENITKVIDFDDQDKLAIVMELLEGKTLNEYVKQKGALSEQEAKTIFGKVLNAFNYAHNKGIVHRDIKPSNIFITKQGNVKIMDFGIAKIVEDGANILTQTGTQMGTPVYMSPEQVKDAKHIDFKTDIYSLGVTLWFMLAGKPIYDDNTFSRFDIYTKIVNEKLPVLDNYPLLSKVIQKATEKDKNKRFENCDRFGIALKEETKTNEKTVIDLPKPVIKEKITNEDSSIKTVDVPHKLREEYPNLIKSLKILSILSFVKLIAFPIISYILRWIIYDYDLSLYDLDLAYQFTIGGLNYYYTTILDRFAVTFSIFIILTTIFIFSIYNIRKKENIKLVYFSQLFNLLLILIAFIIKTLHFFIIINNYDFYQHHIFVKLWTLIEIVFSGYIIYFVYKKRIFKIPNLY